ncbi:helix-turn-helix domain-containing protein [Polynucleobacter rarus]|uniref:helix-turn-helix domain-containing protein n=1 Tax=Polynucleobacter rarus TaxID=556055 RepID=UPI000D3E47C0|nr:helix-turn-helix transcriptional regulator [Polynucleobacter rarus]
MNSRELGLTIALRRTHLGLSQERLAKFCGLSRLTIYRLERGISTNVGRDEFISLLTLLGLNNIPLKSKLNFNSLEMVCVSVSVSYKSSLHSTDLSLALVTGVLPEKIYPHIATFLDETPLSLIISVVEAVAQLNQIPPKLIWKNLIDWAHEMNSPRIAWL